MNRREIEKAVGLNIATWRVRRGMTQQQLADLTGIARGVLSYYECGHRMAPLDALLLIAARLGCPLVTLLSGVPGVLTAAVPV